ncbi:MAG: cytochrome c, partial [Niabella sp.]
MDNHKYLFHQLPLLIIALFFSVAPVFAQDNANINEGKTLFIGKCQSCHSGDMKSNSTGPALGGVEGRWEDKEKLHEWIRNNTKLIASGYPKAIEASKISATAMTTFPDLTDPQIDAILAYIDAKFTGKLDAPKAGDGVAAGGVEASASQNNIMYGVVSFILALVALVLIYVNFN